MTDKIVWIGRAAIAVLLAMVAITYVSGVSQETFEIVREPSVYAADLVAHAAPLRALFGIDTAFLVLYATLLVLVAVRFTTPENRALATIAIGAVLATALLDMVEDHHILAMLRGAECGITPSAGQVEVQHAISQVKFNLGYFAEFLIGLSIPRKTLHGKLLAVLLTAGTLVQGAWLYAAPDHLLVLGNYGRWLGFVVGFALIIRLVRHPGGGAAETSAPA